MGRLDQKMPGPIFFVPVQPWPLGCGVTGDSHHGCAADKSAAAAWCYHINMDQNLRNVSNTLLNLCHEELRQFWRQKGVLPGTSKVYLIKWLVSVYVCVFYIYIYTVYMCLINLNKLIGCWFLLCVCWLGFLLDFISYPVIKGFTCAAAVTISFGQVKVRVSPPSLVISFACFLNVL